METLQFLIAIIVGFVVIAWISRWFLSASDRRAERKRKSAERVPVIDLLEQAGFYRFLQEDIVRDVKRAELEEHDVFFKSGREFFANSEELASGGIGSFLKRLDALLEREGICLQHCDEVQRGDAPESICPEVKEELTENSYLVTIGETRTTVWSDSIHDTDHARGAEHAVIHILNSLLEMAESPERAYGRSHGQNFAVVIATPEQFRLIKDHSLVNSKDEVWLPD